MKKGLQQRRQPNKYKQNYGKKNSKLCKGKKNLLWYSTGHVSEGDDAWVLFLALSLTLG